MNPNFDAAEIAYLAVDWGTSNFRCFAVNSAGQCLETLHRPFGLKQVKDGQFSKTLQDCLEQWLSDYQQYPLFMAGMVGARSGWKEVPYIESPAKGDDLASGCLSFSSQWGGQVFIVPGVSVEKSGERFDVMRGEEVQICGLMSLAGQDDFYCLLPGTHSKHVDVVGGVIGDFTTFMTGELFSVISQHTILAQPSIPETTFNKEAFVKGVKAGKVHNLSEIIFTARSNTLFDVLSTDDVNDYLSGMLIGAELSVLTKDNVWLIGDEKLTHRYEIACEVLNIRSKVANGDECFLRGMHSIWRACTKEEVFTVIGEAAC